MIQTISLNSKKYDVTSLGGLSYIVIDQICSHLGVTMKSQVRKIRSRGWGLQKIGVNHWLTISALEPWLATIESGRLEKKGQEYLKEVRYRLYDLWAKECLAPPPHGDNKLIHVPFDGAEILALRHEELEYVVVQSVCARLGLDPEVQRKFLLRQNWAGETWTSKMAVQLPGNAQARQVFLLNRKRFSMWMACLNQDLVDVEFLPKLQKFQCEAADVLDAYFHRQIVQVGDIPNLQTLGPPSQLLLSIFEARMQTFETKLLDAISKSGVQITTPSLVIPQVSKLGSWSMKSINIYLKDNGYDIYEGDTAVREIAARLGLIDDERYGFWNPLGDATSGLLDYNWRFNTKALDVLAPYLQKYLELSKQTSKNTALSVLLSSITPIGRGKGEMLSKKASRVDSTNGHKALQEPQLRTP